jgi:hypothetical protein
MVLMVALGLAAGTAVAQWTENFDGYANGTVLNNVGGWFGWDNVPAACGTVTNEQALSAPHSMKVWNDDDAVHPYSGYTTGQWVYTAWQYIPSGLDQMTYFIINNLYNHGGPYEWAIETHMNPATGFVNEQLRDPTGVNKKPIIYNQWVEIKTVIDLTANQMQHYYGGQLLASGIWNIRGGPIEIANVDLFAGAPTGHQRSVYYDDFSLVPEPASVLLLIAAAGLLRRR